jgi:hypothetical protein
MRSGRAFQALQAQLTHRGDGLEVGVEAHQHGIVLQGLGSNQQIKTQHRAEDLAAGLAQLDRRLPEIPMGDLIVSGALVWRTAPARG